MKELLEKVENLTVEDILEYILTSVFSDIVTPTTGNIKKLITIPNIIYAKKFIRMLQEGCKNEKDRKKLADYYDIGTPFYEARMEKLLECIDKIDSTAKMEYFSILHNARIYNVISEDLFERFYMIIRNFTPSELKYFYENYGKRIVYNNYIQIYIQYGLIKQRDNVHEEDETYYQYTNLGKKFYEYVFIKKDNSENVNKPISLSDLMDSDGNLMVAISDAEIDEICKIN